MHPYSETVVVLGGQKLGVTARMSELGGKGGAIATFLLGLASLGGGATLWALSHNQDWQTESGAKAAEGLRIGAIGCLASGVVLGAVSLFLFAYDPTPPSSGTTTGPEDFEPSDVASIGGRTTKHEASAIAPYTLIISPLAASDVGGLAVGATF